LKVRSPCQAGAFYSGTKSSLTKQIESCFLHKFGPGKLPEVNRKGKRNIVAVVCPHAGYMYSGAVAANSYYAMAKDGVPKTCVIIGPNHTGMGSGVSLMTEGAWETPIGVSPIDTDLAKSIREQTNIIDIDESAHRLEHSIEVQLPFIQYVYGLDVKLVPICMMMQDLTTSCEVGEAISNAVNGSNVVIIASSDMTHYESQAAASKKDRLVIESILSLDEESLQKVVESQSISMCGYGPITAAIRAAKLLGAKTASLLSYKTSGDITQDKSAVVGYAAVSITK
jgi:AmmeMemoRadiSam system protein B